MSYTGATIGQNLTVCASYPVESITGLMSSFLSGKTLVSRVVMRIEQPPVFNAYTEPGGTC